MSDDYHQMAAECGVPISSERVMHHLRCLSVDCEWQAFEVEQYIKQLERDRDVLAAKVRAARRLGDSSPIALEFCRQQWADARRATDAAKALEEKQ